MMLLTRTKMLPIAGMELADSMDAFDRRTVPRVGYAAAQDDKGFGYNSRLTTNN